MWSALAAPLVAGGASLIGGALSNDANAYQAQKNRDFQAEMSNTAYQRSVADMKAAGINPMLSAKLGGASTPSGSQAQQSDIVTPAVQSAIQTKMNSAQVANIEADTQNKSAQGRLLDAQATAAIASAKQSDSQSHLTTEMVSKVIQETDNLHSQKQVLEGTVKNIFEQTQLTKFKQLSEQEKRLVLQQTIQQVAAEAKLKNLDVDAAQTLNNLGRTTKELTPIIEILKQILRK